MEDKIILGMDPGTTLMGYGIVHVKSKKLHLVTMGVIHLNKLPEHSDKLKRIFERNSPSILIQSLYRGYRSRNYVKIYFNERRQKIIRIQKIARGFLLRLKLKNDLKVTIRCIPEGVSVPGTCPFSGQPSPGRVVVAKSY